jgi:hypothetical protein
MTNLKEARKKGKIAEFVKEHEKEPKGDKDKFDKALDSIAHPSGKSKSVPGTSPRGSSGS